MKLFTAKHWVWLPELFLYCRPVRTMNFSRAKAQNLFCCRCARKMVKFLHSFSHTFFTHNKCANILVHPPASGTGKFVVLIPLFCRCYTTERSASLTLLTNWFKTNHRYSEKWLTLFPKIKQSSTVKLPRTNLKINLIKHPLLALTMTSPVQDRPIKMCQYRNLYFCQLFRQTELMECSIILDIRLGKILRCLMFKNWRKWHTTCSIVMTAMSRKKPEIL